MSPFRWDVTRREQLGTLVATKPSYPYRDFRSDLLRCCARVVAFSANSDLVFVGRSPDAVFHVLSGVLFETSRAKRLSLLNLSMREEEVTPEAARLIEPYFEELELSPGLLARRPHPVAFVDAVDRGTTFEELFRLLYNWCNRDRGDWRSVARKIRFIGLTEQKKTSPKTWRWQQHAAWASMLESRSIKNVSIPLRLYTYLVGEQPKMTNSFPPSRWGDTAVTEPLRDEEAREAIALGLHLFEFGRKRDTRVRFSRELTSRSAMAEPWLRSLVLEMKRH